MRTSVARFMPSMKSFKIIFVGLFFVLAGMSDAWAGTLTVRYKVLPTVNNNSAFEKFKAQTPKTLEVINRDEKGLVVKFTDGSASFYSKNQYPEFYGKSDGDVENIVVVASGLLKDLQEKDKWDSAFGDNGSVLDDNLLAFLDQYGATEDMWEAYESLMNDYRTDYASYNEIYAMDYADVMDIVMDMFIMASNGADSGWEYDSSGTYATYTATGNDGVTTTTVWVKGTSDDGTTFWEMIGFEQKKKDKNKKDKGIIWGKERLTALVNAYAQQAAENAGDILSLVNQYAAGGLTATQIKSQVNSMVTGGAFKSGMQNKADVLSKSGLVNNSAVTEITTGFSLKTISGIRY